MRGSMANKKEPVLEHKLFSWWMFYLASATSTTQYIRLCGDSQQSNTETFKSVQVSTHRCLTSGRTVGEKYSNNLKTE